jgi:hypothetical protein
MYNRKKWKGVGRLGRSGVCEMIRMDGGCGRVEEVEGVG